MQDGVETDARPGALVRGAQPAPSSVVAAWPII
jgi:hypothetical protein